MYVLKLFNYKSYNFGLEIVAVASSKEKLIKLLKVERVPIYRDELGFEKEFREGGALEWYRGPKCDFDRTIHKVKTESEYLEIARIRYRKWLDSILINLS